jgi:hypothetical protein
MQRYVDLVGVLAESLVCGIVDCFLDDVRRIARARIHAGQTLHRLDTAELLH